MSLGPTFCQDTLERAEDCYAKGDRNQARELLEKVVQMEGEMDADDADEIHAKEQAVYRLSEIIGILKDSDALIDLLKNVRPFFALLPKAKTTKMVRKLFERIVQCGVSLSQQHALCLDTIQWARAEKRTFLRHRLQLRLAEVLFEQKKTREALSTLMTLLQEVRRLDDRTLLLDIYLLDSKINYAIRNASKARAALVSARTTANSIYCPPLAQAEIDLQSGVLHADEHDPKTAFSYFYEAFEGFHQLPDKAVQARRALRYMILAKISTNNPDELASLLSSKHVLEYTGADIDALRGIAKAYTEKDIHLFNAVFTRQQKDAEFSCGGSTSSAGVANNTLLFHDEVQRRQLTEMYDTLIEQHLLKIIEPYNRVQISYLASMLSLDEVVVESRISQLILDKKLCGIVDQQHHCLIVFDNVETWATSNCPDDGAVQKDFFENAADETRAEAQDRTTLHQDALSALESYDALVTALFDKVAGKFDALVEENLKKRNPLSATHTGKKGKPGNAASPKDNDTVTNASKKDEADTDAGKKGGGSA